MTKESHPDIRRTLLFLVKDNRILLAMKKRGFGEGKWNGVGGKLEPGETIEQAMIRECQEEIGVTPRSWHKVAELDFVQDTDMQDPWHMFGYVYISRDWEGEPQETEEMRPEWIAIDKIPYDQMWDDDIHWLPQVLNGKLVKGSFTFDHSDKMITHTIEEVEAFNEL